MQLVGVLGSDPEPLVTTLAEELKERGPVAVLRSGNRSTPATEPEYTTYTLGDSRWRGTGGERSLEDILDTLGTNHDTAILVGFPGARAPQVVEDDQEVRRELQRVNSLDAVDPAEVVNDLESARSWESLGSLVATAKDAAGEEFSGAIATFTGRVRAKDGPEDERTEHLAFERYEDVASDRMEALREELTARDGVYEVLLHHRTGVVEAGEDIVFVVVLAGHRKQAFQTVEDGINRLKAEVPIFKKEVTIEDAVWVHNRE
jgi:molybdopterin synthase catalytic subunit